MDTIEPDPPIIARFSETVLLMGGGALSRASVSDLLTRAPNLVACDGAARDALEMGLMPQAVMGDMDSLDGETRARLDPAIIHEITDQETTDFDKALRSIEAPLILGVGFMGLRLDHELACYNALVRHPGVRCILVGEHDICFHLPAAATLALDVPVGSRVSLFPMAELHMTVTGLRWSFDKLRLAPWARVGTSNEAVGLVRISTDRDGLLVILPRALLDKAIAALARL